MGILKNELHPGPERTDLLAAQMGYVLVHEVDLALGRFDQFQGQASGGGLAAAGFTHQTKGFALEYGKVQTVHRFQPQLFVGFYFEIFFQIFNFQDFFHGLVR